MSIIDEKGPTSQISPVVSVSKTPPENYLDNAFTYIQNVGTQDIDIEEVDLKALRRRIDWYIFPLMFLSCMFMSLDKVSLNYAAVMGLITDINLKGNDFTNASTVLSIAYLIAEIPNGYFLQKIPASKWLAFNTIAWGISVGSIAASKNYHHLLASRIFLGIFEAAGPPSFMLICSQYYTRSEQAVRYMYWYCGFALGQIVGALLSFGFQHVESATLSGWRLMFLVLGVITVLIGLAIAIVVPDSPMKAGFMTEREKVALLMHVSENRTGVENRHFKPSHIWELVLDVQMWLMAAAIILITTSSGVISTYSSTVIKQFGYTSKQAALLGMPSGLVSLGFTFAVGFGVRIVSHRWAWLVVCCLPAMIGGALMSFAPKHNKPALLTGIYLVNAITPTIIIIYQWTMANIAGHTKRVVASTLIAACFSVGNIIGPQTFQAKDAPEYKQAKIILLATQASAVFVACVLGAYYWIANKRKVIDQGKVENEGTMLDEREGVWGNLTDKENVRFRYVY